MTQKSHPDEHDEIVRLLPLLGSIGREIRERAAALEVLEARIEALGGRHTPADVAELREAIAEASAHRRGLRLAQAELERLGCSVLEVEPLTLRVPGRGGGEPTDLVWPKETGAME